MPIVRFFQSHTGHSPYPSSVEPTRMGVTKWCVLEEWEFCYSDDRGNKIAKTKFHLFVLFT